MLFLIYKLIYIFIYFKKKADEKNINDSLSNYKRKLVYFEFLYNDN